MTPLTTKFLFLGLILLATTLEVIGDVFFKKWSIIHNQSLLYIGIVLYGIGSMFWILSLKYELLSRAISIITILNLIAIVLIAVLYFKEDLSMINKVGIALGILAVVLIEV